MSANSAPRPSGLMWLYTHNPFYFISAALMIYAVRAAYGELEIGAINSWVMLAVLVGYTLVLAGIGICVIRLGRVWDDARSILLLLLLLFLAVSVSMDDLLVNTSYWPGTILMLAGWGGSLLTSEIVLRATRIRLPLPYRLPLYLLLGLFFVYPWWCSPEINPRTSNAVEWMVCLFPTLAAVAFLTLLPAVRLGRRYVSENGTPWPWPLFPWTPFYVLGAAVAFRSFILSLTYGQTGNIWRDLPGSGRAIAFDVIFGTYFLVPLCLAWLILILEAALVSGNRRLQQRVIYGASGLLLLACPLGTNGVFENFLYRFLAVAGSPVWLTVGLLLAFYGWAAFRRVPGALSLGGAMLALLTFVGPQTISLQTLATPQPWPLLVLGGGSLCLGVWRRSSASALAGIGSLTAALWLALPHSIAADFRNLICFHAFWLAITIVSVVYKDQLARVLNATAALAIPVMSWAALADPRLTVVPWTWKLVYLASLLTVALLVGWLGRQRRFLWAAGGTCLGFGFGGFIKGYYAAVHLIGRPAMTALSWSVGTLIIGVLISAVKAQWVSQHLFTRWMPSLSPSEQEDPAPPQPDSEPLG